MGLLLSSLKRIICKHMSKYPNGEAAEIVLVHLIEYHNTAKSFEGLLHLLCLFLRQVLFQNLW